MQWSNLQTMKCPTCSKNLTDVGMGYRCRDTNCAYFIGYEKFQKLINEMMMPKKPRYDPDKVDRSGWEW